MTQPCHESLCHGQVTSISHSVYQYTVIVQKFRLSGQKVWERLSASELKGDSVIRRIR